MATKKGSQSNVAWGDNSEVRRSVRAQVQRADSASAAEALFSRNVAMSRAGLVTGALFPSSSRLPKDQRTDGASPAMANDRVVAPGEYFGQRSHRTHPSTTKAIFETQRSAGSRAWKKHVEVARNERVPSIETPAKTSPIVVAVVDDDRPFSEALIFQLVTAGFQAVAYPSAEDLLATIRSCEFDCIVADILLPGINGLELFTQVKESVPFASIIFVTGIGEFSIGVQAMREGAIDCLEKPIDDEVLVNSIRHASEHYRRKRAAHQKRVELQEREGTLTPREHEVFGLIASGLLNKQVGATLGATERTIKTHRGRVMDKMCADSLADLVRMADILRIQATF